MRILLKGFCEETILSMECKREIKKEELTEIGFYKRLSEEIESIYDFLYGNVSLVKSFDDIEEYTIFESSLNNEFLQYEEMIVIHEVDGREFVVTYSYDYKLKMHTICLN